MGGKRSSAAWGVGCGVALIALGAGAQQPPRLQVTPLPVLAVGGHAALTVQLSPASLNERPWMLTASAEGAAVEVVRGRVLRGEAKDSAEPVSLEIPLLAREEGRTVVHLRFDGYRCDPDCRPVSLEAAVVLESRR